jgi:P4 family phage/plasmid primase-like protien
MSWMEEFTTKHCRDCKFKPRSDVGKCRNPDRYQKSGSQNITYADAICDKFKAPEKQKQTTHSESEEVSIIDTANQVMQLHPVITLRDNLKEIYYYHNGVYLYGAEAQIRQVAQELLGKDTGIGIINEIVYYIQNATFVNRDQINQNKYLINLKNGLFDLNTHELKPHSSAILSTCQIPVNFNPKATCPEISTFLCEILRPLDIALVLQEIGYCLIPDYSIQKAFLWNGSGLNGKGTLGRLLYKFLGEQNKSTQSLKSLNLDKFSAAHLYGKLVNIDMDLTNESISEDTMFKKLTGGDMISAERKYQDCFDFINVAKLLFGCNDIPQHLKGGDYAYFRRWILTDFPCKFEGTSEDKNLDAKLQTEEELSGFLNVCLYALQWLLQTKTFFYNKTPEEVQKEYLLKSNSVIAFMEECTTPADDYVRTADLYLEYQKWGQLKQIRKIEAPNIFGKMLKRAGYVSIRPDSYGDRSPSYYGIKIDDKKLAEISKTNPDGTLTEKNQHAYTHWFTKDSIYVRVVRDKSLLLIIENCVDKNTVTDSDLIQSICKQWGNNPDNPDVNLKFEKKTDSKDIIFSVRDEKANPDVNPIQLYIKPIFNELFVGGKATDSQKQKAQLQMAISYIQKVHPYSSKDIEVAYKQKW